MAHPDAATAPDSLVRFAERFLSNPIGLLNPPPTPVLSQGPVVHFLLHRSGEYQVEQYVVIQPEAVFPSHRHPHVDTIEVKLIGEMLFTIEGVPTPSNLLLTIRPPSEPPLVRKAVRIRHNQEHWLKVGPTGGTFLSFQHWATAPPRSVVLDWDGMPFDEVHQRNLARLRDGT